MLAQSIHRPSIYRRRRLRGGRLALFAIVTLLVILALPRPTWSQAPSAAEPEDGTVQHRGEKRAMLADKSRQAIASTEEEIRALISRAKRVPDREQQLHEEPLPSASPSDPMNPKHR